MRYLIADIKKINKYIRSKTFEQKVIDVVLDKEKSGLEKRYLLKQIIRSEELKTTPTRCEKVEKG